MIIGQILLNGAPYSCHRYSDGRYTVGIVRQLLRDLTKAERLYELGTIEIHVQSQGGLERLKAALWG